MMAADFGHPADGDMTVLGLVRLGATQERVTPEWGLEELAFELRLAATEAHENARRLEIEAYRDNSPFNHRSLAFFRLRAEAMGRAYQIMKALAASEMGRVLVDEIAPERRSGRNVA